MVSSGLRADWPGFKARISLRDRLRFYSRRN